MEKFAQLRSRAICAEGERVAPEWIELLPSGPVLDGRDGRTWMLADPQKVVNAFAEDGKSLPIDYEHATEIKGPVGEPAPAVAWIEEMEVRDGCVWGRVDWNEEGRRAVETRQYRYISPVFDYARVGRHILRLTSVGLTNMPNFHLSAMNRNARPSCVGSELEEGMLKAICRALGLKEDASEQDVLDAIAKQKSDVASAKNREKLPDLSSFVPRAEFDRMEKRALNAEQTVADREKAELDTSITAELDAAVEAGKIAPASKEYFSAMCRTEGGLEKFREFIKGAPEVVKGSGLDGKNPASAESLSDDERAACRLMGVSKKEFLKMKEAE